MSSEREFPQWRPEIIKQCCVLGAICKGRSQSNSKEAIKYNEITSNPREILWKYYY